MNVIFYRKYFYRNFSDFPFFSDLQDFFDMVVPKDHELHKAIQVAPLILSDDVRRQKVSTTLVLQSDNRYFVHLRDICIIDYARTFYLRRLILWIIHPELFIFYWRSWKLTLHHNLSRNENILNAVNCMIDVYI